MALVQRVRPSPVAQLAAAIRTASRVGNGKSNLRGMVARNSLVSLDAAFKDVLRIFATATVNLVFLLLAAVCGVMVYYTHYHWPSTWIGAHCTNSTSWYCVFLTTYPLRILGFLVLLPNIARFAKAKDDATTKMVAMGVVLLLWCMAVPEASLWQYIAQSIALFVLMHARVASVRIFTILIILGAWKAGYFILQSDPAGIQCAPGDETCKIQPSQLWRTYHRVPEPSGHTTGNVDHDLIHDKILKGEALTPDENRQRLEHRAEMFRQGYHPEHAVGGSYYKRRNSAPKTAGTAHAVPPPPPRKPKE